MPFTLVMGNLKCQGYVGISQGLPHHTHTHTHPRIDASLVTLRHFCCDHKFLLSFVHSHWLVRLVEIPAFGDIVRGRIHSLPLLQLTPDGSRVLNYD